MQPQHHINEVLGSLYETTSEKVTAAVAWGAILSPWWLPMAHDLAAQWAPLLGVIWLLVQIVDKLVRLSRTEDRHKDGEE